MVAMEMTNNSLTMTWTEPGTTVTPDPEVESTAVSGGVQVSLGFLALVLNAAFLFSHAYTGRWRSQVMGVNLILSDFLSGPSLILTGVIAITSDDTMTSSMAPCLAASFLQILTSMTSLISLSGVCAMQYFLFISRNNHARCRLCSSIITWTASAAVASGIFLAYQPEARYCYLPEVASNSILLVLYVIITLLMLVFILIVSILLGVIYKKRGTRVNGEVVGRDMDTCTIQTNVRMSDTSDMCSRQGSQDPNNHGNQCNQEPQPATSNHDNKEIQLDTSNHSNKESHLAVGKNDTEAGRREIAQAWPAPEPEKENSSEETSGEKEIGGIKEAKEKTKTGQTEVSNEGKKDNTTTVDDFEIEEGKVFSSEETKTSPSSDSDVTSGRGTDMTSRQSSKNSLINRKTSSSLYQYMDRKCSALSWAEPGSRVESGWSMVGECRSHDPTTPAVVRMSSSMREADIPSEYEYTSPYYSDFLDHEETGSNYETDDEADQQPEEEPKRRRKLASTTSSTSIFRQVETRLESASRGSGASSDGLENRKSSVSSNEGSIKMKRKYNNGSDVTSRASRTRSSVARRRSMFKNRRSFCFSESSIPESGEEDTAHASVNRKRVSSVMSREDAVKVIQTELGGNITEENVEEVTDAMLALVVMNKTGSDAIKVSSEKTIGPESGEMALRNPFTSGTVIETISESNEEDAAHTDPDSQSRKSPVRTPADAPAAAPSTSAERDPSNQKPEVVNDLEPPPTVIIVPAGDSPGPSDDVTTPSGWVARTPLIIAHAMVTIILWIIGGALVFTGSANVGVTLLGALSSLRPLLQILFIPNIAQKLKEPCKCNICV